MIRFFLLRMRDAIVLSLIAIIYALLIAPLLPQGDHIAYIRLNEASSISEVRLFDLERDLHATLFSMFGRIDELSWSPEGDRLYFGAFRGERIGRDLAALDVGSGAFTWLTNMQPDNNVPSPSPDGRTLAFQHLSEQNGDWDIHLLDLATGETRPLYASVRVDARPIWSADGATVIVEHYDSYGMCLMHVTVATGAWETGTCGEEDAIAWTADRRFRAYDLYRDGFVDIFIDGEGLDRRRLTFMRGFAYAPDWSQDGTRLVFVYRPLAGNTDTLYTVRANGDGLNAVADFDAVIIAPTWRPR